MHINLDKIDELIEYKYDNLSDSEIENFKNVYYKSKYFFDEYFCKYDSKFYHKKKYYYIYETLFNELIGVLISNELGAKIPLPKILKYKNEILLLSENFMEFDKKYYLLHKLFPNLDYEGYDSRLNLYNLDKLDIISDLDNTKKYKTNIEDLKKLKYDLKLMIVSDYIRNQKDRVFRNFMFEAKEDHIKMMPLYDFEHSFEVANVKDTTYNIFIFDLTTKDTKKYIKKDDDFQELLYKAIEIDINSILQKICEQFYIKLDNEEEAKIKSIFESRQNKIKMVKILK